MNPERVAGKLGLSRERLEALHKTVIKRSSWPEPRLWRFDKPVSGVEAGTVIFENGEIVHGYPKIRRAMMLGPALTTHFSGNVAVEEKMNGYNVRIVSYHGDLLALTRGGFICPFSTEVARKNLHPRIFEDNPDLVLCGEMVGPDNPYVPKRIYQVKSIEFFLFDLSHKNSKRLMGVARTHELAKEYGIRTAPLLGEFQADRAYPQIVEIVRRLGRAGREGVIIKDSENRVGPVKYTTSESNCSDLQFAFRYYNDNALDFFVSRAVREGFQSVEWGEGPEEFKARALRLGESIMGPLSETIRNKMAGEEIVQQVQIRVRSIQTARDFEQHLRRSGTRAIFDIPEPDGDEYLIHIIKPVMSTNDKTEALVKGQFW
ncbi:MAG TPA: RNA ligase [Methanotrichaceae archaeon]|nr:RNA ligase [Methanotrichaceae archaeon]HQF16255.1 RNA ligase [Methanotrichaceae archaeon]HQI90027.1 RNA ligase [Methanotrichaceae archaeon]HQJ27949.1 RNA ligase [Methanotrichaceae archaeon]